MVAPLASISNVCHWPIAGAAFECPGRVFLWSRGVQADAGEILDMLCHQE